jgi:hypothetical protein
VCVAERPILRAVPTELWAKDNVGVRCSRHAADLIESKFRELIRDTTNLLIDIRESLSIARIEVGKRDRYSINEIHDDEGRVERVIVTGIMEMYSWYGDCCMT